MNHSFKSKGSEAGTNSRLQDRELRAKISMPNILPGPEKVQAVFVE